MDAGSNSIIFDDLEWLQTRVSRSLCNSKSNISKPVRFRDKVNKKNTNRKPIYNLSMVPLLMTLSDLWSRFQGRHFLKSNIVKTAHLKDKVTIAQEETIPNIWNGIPCLQCDLDRPLNAIARVYQHQLSFLFHNMQTVIYSAALATT